MASGDQDKSEKPRVRLIARKADRNTWVRIELREGKHHQVKKMCEAVSHPVLKLIRRSFGGITTRGVPRTGVRPLTEEEIRRLKAMTGLAGKTPAPRRGRTRPKTSRKAVSIRG
jgi:23S rRNA pseudouridine2605 synthase